MSAKLVLVVCAQAFLIQNGFSQCANRVGGLGFGAPFGMGAAGLNAPAFGTGYGRFGTNTGLTSSLGNSLAYDGTFAPAIEITSTTGGALPVTSASAIAPNSIAVASENVYEGALDVIGELPFVGTVGLEGVLPTAGSGAVNHACGNGVTRIVSQNGAAASSIGSGIAPGFGAGISPAGFGAGNMFGQGIGAYGPAGAIGSASPFGYRAGLGGFGNSAAGLAGAYPDAGLGAGFASYGGSGEGNVAVAGEMPVAGNTVVNGQVPIMGAVGFNGAVPAAGAVSISGSCACGCNNSYLY